MNTQIEEKWELPPGWIVLNPNSQHIKTYVHTAEGISVYQGPAHDTWAVNRKGVVAMFPSAKEAVMYAHDMVVLRGYSL